MIMSRKRARKKLRHSLNSIKKTVTGRILHLYCYMSTDFPQETPG